MPKERKTGGGGRRGKGMTRDAQQGESYRHTNYNDIYHDANTNETKS